MAITYSSPGKETVSEDISEESGEETGEGLISNERMAGAQKIWAHHGRVKR